MSPQLRVLSVAHNAVAASNRSRLEALRAVGDLNVSLLTPRWWFEEGRRIDVPRSAPWRVGRTIFTGNGTRHAYVSGLIGALREETPDVIDLYEEPFSVVALQTLVLRELLAPRAAVVFYSAVNVQQQWRAPYRWIEQATLKQADGAHVPSRDVVPILRAKGFVRAPLAVIPLGVQLDRFSCAAPLELTGLPRPRVGFVGRLEPVKGLDVLLDAIGFLTQPASVIIAGAGSERRHLETRVATMARKPTIMPPVNYADMPSFLKSLDILVLPSVTILPLHREQFGRVLIEAMAAGVAVVGSSSGAIPEVIGDAGLVVPEGDAQALSTAIDRLLGDDDFRQANVERGRQRVRTRFAWPVVAAQTNALFCSALAHRRRAAAGVQAVKA